MKTRIAIALVAAVAIAGVLAGSLSAAGSANPKICGSFQLKGKTYMIAAFGTGCGKAKAWSPKMARRAPARSGDAYLALPGGPAGFQCVALYYKNKVTGGGCVKPTNTAVKFVWTQPL